MNTLNAFGFSNLPCTTSKQTNTLYFDVDLWVQQGPFEVSS